MSDLSEQRSRLMQQWKQVCLSQQHSTILDFFDNHKTGLLSLGSWFINILITLHDTKSVEAILGKTNPKEYINNKCKQTNSYPVLNAIRTSTVAMIKILISNGATVSNLPNLAYGPIHEILKNNKVKSNEKYECIVYFVNTLQIKRIDASSFIYHFCYSSSISYDRIKIASFLKEKNLLNARDLSSYFHWAMDGPHLDDKFTDWMLNNGANPDPASCFSHATPKAVDFLLKYGYDINGTDRINSCTPVLLCCLNKNLTQIKLLMRNGADINKKCKYDNKTISAFDYVIENFWFQDPIYIFLQSPHKSYDDSKQNITNYKLAVQNEQSAMDNTNSISSNELDVMDEVDIVNESCDSEMIQDLLNKIEKQNSEMNEIRK
eukprot:414473_1